MKFTVLWSTNDGVCYQDFENFNDAVQFVLRMKNYGYDDAHVISLN